MRIIRTAVYLFFLCCVPVLILTSNIGWEVTEIRLYEYALDKYPISDVTGMDEVELRGVYQHLIDYYNLKVDYAQVEVMLAGEKLGIFNEKELVHLADIRGLVQLDYMIQRVVLIVMVICGATLLLWSRDRWRVLLKGLFRGSLITLVLVGLLAVVAVFFFDQLFLLFHLVSFSNENWILDPSRDYLIMLFPGAFFYDAAMLGFGVIIVEALLLGGISFTVLKLGGKQKD